MMELCDWIEDRKRRSVGEDPLEKIRQRRSVREDPTEKIRRRRSD